jgi:dipeptidyl aminopeptidase/acylaminoacyl peptidase
MILPILILSALVALQAPAPAPPDTEIFLATLSVDGRDVHLGDPVNVSNSPGYDNQPSFTPDGAAVLFASGRGGASQTDIYRYDIARRQVVRITQTPESEYSPTVTPDGGHISVVRVEPDKTQRLWQFTRDGRLPQLVLSEIKPVGYHVWIDDHTLGLFVLGSPATLQVADTRTGKATVVASGIGRSLQRIPGKGSISFVVREPGASGEKPSLSIREFDARARRTAPIVWAVPGASEADCAWTPDGLLLMAHGGVLYGWRPGDADWRRVADLGALGLNGVTRLAVSPAGDRIAIVAQPR